MIVNVKVIIIWNVMSHGLLVTFWKNLLHASSVWKSLLCWYLGNKSHGIRFQIPVI